MKRIHKETIFFALRRAVLEHGVKPSPNDFLVPTQEQSDIRFDHSFTLQNEDETVTVFYAIQDGKVYYILARQPKPKPFFERVKNFVKGL